MRLPAIAILLLSCASLFAEPPIRPDPKLTPGATLDVTAPDICTPGHSKNLGKVSADVNRQVFAEYGIPILDCREYELDHLIPLELGGSNSIRNLWPESFCTQPWNATVKNMVENRLHEMVCCGELSLKTAQKAIASDWIAAFREYVSTDPSVAYLPWNRQEPWSVGKTGSLDSFAPLAAPVSGRVWVDMHSRVFWRLGTAHYGKTRRGRYLAEADALTQGFRPAKGQ